MPSTRGPMTGGPSSAAFAASFVVGAIERDSTGATARA
jgi:hypothetical protein